MKIVKSTQTGLVRKNNQDNYLVKEDKKKELVFLMVLDGVGGSNAGEVASAMVADLFSEKFDSIPLYDTLGNYKKWTVDTLAEINERLYNMSHQDNQYVGMSTTCVCALFTPYGDFFINVGDSRLYMIDHRQELVQLSTDHSLVNDLLLKGTISVTEAENHPMRHALTNALGIYQVLRCDVQEILLPYKLILLCSDGVSGYVKHEVMQEILTDEKTDLEEKKNLLNEAVNQAGAVDNYTLIMMEV